MKGARELEIKFFKVLCAALLKALKAFSCECVPNF